MRKNVISTAELRAKADKCFRLARSLPPGEASSMLQGFGEDYLDLAQRFERRAAPVVAPEESAASLNAARPAPAGGAPRKP
jgi:hypothetical protein